MASTREGRIDFTFVPLSRLCSAEISKKERQREGGEGGKEERRNFNPLSVVDASNNLLKARRMSDLIRKAAQGESRQSVRRSIGIN